MRKSGKLGKYKKIYTWTVGNSKFTRGFIMSSDSSATNIIRLIEEAKRDFPWLTNNDLEIGKVIRSRGMNNHILVTFLLPNDEKHESYAQCGQIMNFEY